MWGFRPNLDRKTANNIYELILNRELALKYNQNSLKGQDQYFLADKIYPLIRDNSIIHDSYLCNSYKDSEPFPTKRKGNCFVAFNELQCNETSSQFYECPRNCRPKEHLDWLNC